MNGHRLHARARLFAGPGLGHSTAHPCSVNSVHSERNWQHVTSPQVAPEEENGQSAPSVLRGRGEAQGVTAGIRKRSRGSRHPLSHVFSDYRLSLSLGLCTLSATSTSAPTSGICIRALVLCLPTGATASSGVSLTGCWVST